MMPKGFAALDGLMEESIKQGKVEDLSRRYLALAEELQTVEKEIMESSPIGEPVIVNYIKEANGILTDVLCEIASAILESQEI